MDDTIACGPSKLQPRFIQYAIDRQTRALFRVDNGSLEGDVSPMHYYIPRINRHAEPPFHQVEHLDISTTWRGVGENFFLAEALADLEHSFRRTLAVVLGPYFEVSPSAASSSVSGPYTCLRSVNVSVSALGANIIQDVKERRTCNSKLRFLTDKNVVDCFIRLHDCFTFPDEMELASKGILRVDVRVQTETSSKCTMSTLGLVRWYPDMLEFEDLNLCPEEGQNYYLKPKLVSVVRHVTVTFSSTCPWLNYSGHHFQGTIPCRKYGNYHNLPVVIKAVIKAPLSAEQPTIYVESIIRVRLTIWSRPIPLRERLSSVNTWYTPSFYGVRARCRKDSSYDDVDHLSFSRSSSLSISSISPGDTWSDCIPKPHSQRVRKPRANYRCSLAACPADASSFESVVRALSWTCTGPVSDKSSGETQRLLINDCPAVELCTLDNTLAEIVREESGDGDSASDSAGGSAGTDLIYYNPFAVLRKRTNIDQSSESTAVTSRASEDNTHITAREASEQQQENTFVRRTIQQGRPLQLPGQSEPCRESLADVSHSSNNEAPATKERSKDEKQNLLSVDSTKRTQLLTTVHAEDKDKGKGRATSEPEADSLLRKDDGVKPQTRLPIRRHTGSLEFGGEEDEKDAAEMRKERLKMMLSEMQRKMQAGREECRMHEHEMASEKTLSDDVEGDVAVDNEDEEDEEREGLSDIPEESRDSVDVECIGW